jgi:hypothetical protein
VTLLATTDADGNALPEFDGSTWDPWARRLLFTAEAGADGGVWAADLSVPAKVEDVSGAFGRGGYEGIQNESDGNLWIVEDAGGPNGAVNSDARQPNSFVFRYVPAWPGDLKNGKLQVLQMLNESGTPILFHSGQADADILSPDVKLLYTHGKSLQTRWITIHDTAVDGERARRHAVQATRERAVQARREVPRVLLRRDGRHERPDRGRIRLRRLRRSFQAHAEETHPTARGR